jgi:hypothetical protein
MRRSVLTGVLAIALTTGSANAQQVGDRLVAVKIDFAKNVFWLENFDGSSLKDGGRQQASTLATGKNNDVFLEKRNQAKLIIVRGNPLVYKYSSLAKDLIETDNYKAASLFAAALETLVQSLGAVAARGAATGVTPDGTSVSTSDVSTNPEVVAIFKKQNINNLAEANAFFTELETSITELGKKTADMPSIFDLAKTDQSKAKQRVCNGDDACTWGLDTIDTVITSHFTKLAAIRTDLNALLGIDRIRNDLVNNAVTQVWSQRDEVMSALKAAKTFASAASHIDLDVALPDDAPYDASHNRPIDVTRSELGLDGKEPANGAKIVTNFMFRPYSAVTYGFGGFLAYSFVRDHEFKASKKGDQLVITDAKGTADYVGRQIGAVLTISPTRWVDTPFTPEAEIGVNPTKDQVGLFLGAGFSPFSLFQFGFGFTLQQVSQLTDGQFVGQPATSQDDIHTVTRFKPGGYLHISVTKKVGTK